MTVFRAVITAQEFMQIFDGIPSGRWSRKEMEYLVGAVPPAEWEKIPLDKQRAALKIAL